MSPVYETEPLHVTDQPRFLNLAVKGVTRARARGPPGRVKRIEDRMGRRPGARYGPRPIDIDILFFDDRVIRTDALEVPHPRVAERAFVLAPLHDIAPDLVTRWTGAPSPSCSAPSARRRASSAWSAA